MPNLSDFDISTIPTERVAAVVLKCNRPLTREQQDFIREQWDNLSKGIPKLPPCILLDNGIDIQGIAELPDNA